MRSRLDIIPSSGKAVGVALCVGLVVLPMLAGGATPFGQLMTRLAAIAAFLLFLSGRHVARDFEPLHKPLAALLFLALFGMVQSAAWPRSLVAAVSPEHVELADEAALAAGLELPARVPLSVYPPGTREVTVDCLIFFALAVAAFQAGRRRYRRRWLAAAILTSACVQVVLGLRPWLAGQVPRLRGTYANPDHLCILLEIAACVAFAAIFWALSSRSWGDRPEFRITGALVAGALTLTLISAVAFTGSRAGLMAVLAGLTVLAAASARGRTWLPVALVGIVALGSAGFLAWIGAGKSFGRLTSTSWFEVAWGARSLVWRDSVEWVVRSPITGSGLGTFDDAFPLVQSASLEGQRWAKAHNDILELLVTGGLVGFAVAGLGAALLLTGLVRKLRSAKRTEDRLALASALGCLVAVAVHETFDFGLSLSANAFALTVVVAASLGVRVGPKA